MHQGTIINAEELFGNFSNLSKFQNMEDGSEKNWKWPDADHFFFPIISLFLPC